MRTCQLAVLGAVLAGFCLTPSLYAADYYVDATSGDDAPGRGSHDQPWKTVNYALDHINGSEQESHKVLVAEGTYVENVVCDAYESVYGGYEPTSWSRDPDTHETTIDGNSDGSVVVLGEAGTVDGCTLTNGSRDYGGGVYCRQVNASILNCRITENEATANHGGSAIYIYGGTVQIAGAIIEQNTNTAILIDSGTAMIGDSVISDTINGRGVYATSLTSLTLSSNTIQRNTGAGVYIDSGTATFENNVISETASGHGIHAINAVTLELSNDRILRNAQLGVLMQGGTLTGTSCIVGHNQNGGLLLSSVTNSVLEDSLISSNQTPTGYMIGGGRYAGAIKCSGNIAIRRTVLCQNWYGDTMYFTAGGIHVSGNCSVVDSIIVDNNSSRDISCSFGSDTTFTNNFIVGGGKIILRGTSITSVNNSVLFNNSGYESTTPSAAITMINDLLWGNGDDLNLPVIEEQAISHCNIEDGDLNGINGNISVNPDFLGEIGSGTMAELVYNPDNCRTTITDSIGGYIAGALARTFLWINDTAFYVESNTETDITVYGDVTAVASQQDVYVVEDYHLHPLSMCVDAGMLTDDVPDHDFEDDPRPSFGNTANEVDMGADEYVPSPLFLDLDISPDPANQASLLTVTFTATETLVSDPMVTVGGNPAIKQDQVGLSYTCSYQVSGADIEGENLVSVTGEAVSGMLGGLTGTVLFDFTPPDAPVITTNDGADFTIGITPFTFAGTCGSDAADMKLNDTSFGHTSGDTTWQNDVTLSAGTNPLSFTAVDVAFNESDPALIVVTHDPAHDWDGDGLPDAEEGTGDWDDDGIPDYLDPDLPVGFSQDEYTFAVERDYNQARIVTIVNNDAEAHDVWVELTEEPPADLALGFTGQGSEDTGFVSLSPGAGLEVRLMVHAQDATLHTYHFTARLHAMIGATELAISTEIEIQINEPYISFTFAEVAAEDHTQIETLRVNNFGDTLTDLRIHAGDNLNDLLVFQPNVEHGLVPAGDSLSVDAIPDLRLLLDDPTHPSAGYVYASAAGVTEELYLDFGCLEGDSMYTGTLYNQMIRARMHDWYCTNKPAFESYFNLPSGFSVENIQKANLAVYFELRSGWVHRPHSLRLLINGYEIASLVDIIPDGRFEFEVPVDDPVTGDPWSPFILPLRGVARNTVRLEMIGANPGHYVVATDFLVTIAIDEVSLTVCAESQEAASEYVNNHGYFQPQPPSWFIDEIEVRDSADELIEDCGAVQLGAEYTFHVTTEDTSQELYLVARPDNGDPAFLLDWVSPGHYSGAWIPQNPSIHEDGRCIVHFFAGVCHNGTATACVTLSTGPLTPDFEADPVEGPPPLWVQFTDLTLNGPPTEWLWDFGDGAHSTEQNPMHCYENEAEYTVSLTVNDGSGPATTTRIGYIVVRVPVPPRPLGDLDDDGLVNAIDVQHTINQALGIPKPEGIAKADINSDGLINAIDVQLIINAALGIDISGFL